MLEAQLRIVTYALFLTKKIIKTYVMNLIFQYLIQYRLFIQSLAKKPDQLINYQNIGGEITLLLKKTIRSNA